MTRSATPLGWLLSGAAAQTLIVLGLSLLLNVFRTNGPIEAGVALLAAGAFLAMRGVIDRLVPDAGSGFTSALKASAVALFFLCGTLTLYGVMTGQYDLR